MDNMTENNDFFRTVVYNLMECTERLENSSRRMAAIENEAVRAWTGRSAAIYIKNLDKTRQNIISLKKEIENLTLTM